MFRMTVASITLALVTSAAGCRMCTTPYDDCSPTFIGECGEACSPNARAGSILAGTVTLPPDEQLLEYPDAYDEEPVSGVVFSVMDRKVEPSDAEVPPQAQEPTVAGEAAAPSQGWTAAKSARTRSF